MPFTLSSESALPEELREIVSRSGRLLGEVIQRESGENFYAQVEELRAAMAALRGRPAVEVSAELAKQLTKLRALDSRGRRGMARAFTFFLELMNACENAYRAHRIAGRPTTEFPAGEGPESLVYVLTAHPTEARSPENIQIFQGIQAELGHALAGEPEVRWRDPLVHQLELAWRAFPTRERAPRVKDEADHIYHLSLRPEILRALLSASREVVPVYLRTWVGGDKDGHPGVDEHALRDSLALSRRYLLTFAGSLLDDVAATLALLPGRPLHKELARTRGALAKARNLGPGDGGRVARAKAAFLTFCEDYEREIHALHPRLAEGKRLFYVFPGLVVPLELRESSDVLMAKVTKPRAIERMLKALSAIARGGEAVWYARGFIVSMTSEAGHLFRAEHLMTAAFGIAALPVIPLFETDESLDASVGIVRATLKDARFGRAVRKNWGQFEIMVGYSDSSKQGGVLPSRLAIARAMHALEAECEAAGVKPVFFQGSGGSVDRGGGSVQEQVAWWPKAALRTYKVTIQGEMVERSLSSPGLTRGQIERIAGSAGEALRKNPQPPKSAALFRLAGLVTERYRAMIHDADFLRVVNAATPYAHLSELKIGSRPTRRTTEVSVEGLRAIPWVLCWTQTRVLFQTWWGVGGAWRALSEGERKDLARAFREEPVFNSYVKALGFTLAKVELPLWKIYLDESGLPPELAARFYAAFGEELAAAGELVRALSGSDDPLWFRHWLGASIRLRSPMIHPLNLLQLLAMEEGDTVLFRLAATGISAGMMTTG